MDIEKIKEIVELIEESETDEFEIELKNADGSAIKIRKGSPEGNSFSQINSGNIGKALTPAVSEE